MVDPFTAGALAAATPFVTDLVKEILTDSAKEGGKGLLNWGGKKLPEATQQKIFNASQQYVETYRQRHCTLKVLGMKQPVALETIYTAVRFLDSAALREFAGINELEQSFRQTREQRFRQRDAKTQPGIQVANSQQFLMVLGPPGAGKSTFLRKMGLEALKGKRKEFKHRCIPVFLELKRLTGEFDLEQRIAEEFVTCGFPDAKGFTRKALEQGRLLILLDGLDEVPTANLNRTIQTIQDFVDRYDKNRYIASCRVAAYRSSFRRFTDVTMAEFDDDQIQQFIGNWFQSEADRQAKTAAKCWELLQKPEYAAAKELAHTPLLLTFLCLSYDRTLTFPNNRSTLYGKALRILLEEWAGEKRLENQRQIYEGLSVELEEMLLAEIAARGFVKDQLFFPQRDLVERIKRFLSNNLNAPKHLDGEAVLNAIAVQQGILVERAEAIYSFSHLTLQEYLTAQYLANNPQFIPKIVSRYLTDVRWSEVFRLIAGLLTSNKGTEQLLRQMEQQAQTYINTAKLKALLNWADQATAESAGNFKPAAKRAVAAYLAGALTNDLTGSDSDSDLASDLGRTLASASALARTLALAGALAGTRILARDLARDRDLALDLASALASASALDHKFHAAKVFRSVDFTALHDGLQKLRLAPANDRPDTIRGAFIKQIQQTWFNALQLDPEGVELSQEEIKALENYLYINQLMVQCRNAAVRLSPQGWAEIEARMLKPVD